MKSEPMSNSKFSAGYRTDVSSAMFVVRPDVEVELRAARYSLYHVAQAPERKVLCRDQHRTAQVARTTSCLVAEAQLDGMRTRSPVGSAALVPSWSARPERLPATPMHCLPQRPIYRRQVVPQTRRQTQFARSRCIHPCEGPHRLNQITAGTIEHAGPTV